MGKTHTSVLLHEVVNSLDLQRGDWILDCTLGLGGHSEKILEAIGPDGRLIGIEADTENLKEAEMRLAPYKEQIALYHDNFENLESVLEQEKKDKVDGILFDLGLSSPHVDEAERGFSFQSDGPLDMRFDRSISFTAADIVNRYHERDLIRIFREYGEERAAPRIVRAIIQARKAKPFETTFDLKTLIEAVIRLPRHVKRHPATKVFQALRIEVNQELVVLKTALEKAVQHLNLNSRLVVISYHSLEDRIVKRFIKECAKQCTCPPEIPICQCENKAKLKIITKKPIIPTGEEIDLNPRSRSAKMRVAEKI